MAQNSIQFGKHFYSIAFVELFLLCLFEKNNLQPPQRKNPACWYYSHPEDYFHAGPNPALPCLDQQLQSHKRSYLISETTEQKIIVILKRTSPQGLEFISRKQINKHKKNQQQNFANGSKNSYFTKDSLLSFTVTHL